jgi:hypothetical protein
VINVTGVKIAYRIESSRQNLPKNGNGLIRVILMLRDISSEEKYRSGYEYNEKHGG